jgi:hypothetical protein
VGNPGTVKGMTRPAPLPRLLLTSFALVVLAGCSGNPTSSDASVPNSADGTAQPTTSGNAGPFVLDVSVPPGSSTNFEGARSDVSVDSCASNDGRWTAEGVATNSADSVRSYRVYVAFVDSTKKTWAMVQSDVADVDAGESSTWSASADLPNLMGGRCVLRVERFAP